MMANVYSFATLGFAGNKNFVKALKRNSPVFWQISNAFIQPASKVMIIRSFYETDKIANHLVSQLLCISNARGPIPTDHIVRLSIKIQQVLD